MYAINRDINPIHGTNCCKTRAKKRKKGGMDSTFELGLRYPFFLYVVHAVQTIVLKRSELGALNLG